MDDLYKNIPFDEIPWNLESPPKVLVDLLKTSAIKPCRAIDLGCGLGNYVHFLAQQGFQMTGIDWSPTAIDTAKSLAKKKSIECDFYVANLLGKLEMLKGKFDFAYDWGVLHHIFPENRNLYVRNIKKILNPGAIYLSVCFHEQDNTFIGGGKYRKTGLGNILYFSSEEELEELFSPFFHIIDLNIIQIFGKDISHLANYVLMKNPI